MLVAGITAHSQRPLCFAVEQIAWVASPGSFHSRALQTNGDGRSWQVDPVSNSQQPSGRFPFLDWRGGSLFLLRSAYAPEAMKGDPQCGRSDGLAGFS